MVTTASLGVALLLAAASPNTPQTLAFAPHANVAIRTSSSVVERATDAARLLAQLNAERSTHGLRPLSVDDGLSRVAREHALEMANLGYFGHASANGASPFDRMTEAHCRFGYAGENLALDRDAAGADRALWNSSEHRDNTLQPHYNRVGIAAVETRDGELFVEDFSD